MSLWNLLFIFIPQLLKSLLCLSICTSLVLKKRSLNGDGQLINQWIQKRPWHMPMEIQVLAWDRHKNVAVLNFVYPSFLLKKNNFLLLELGYTRKFLLNRYFHNRLMDQENICETSVIMVGRNIEIYNVILYLIINNIKHNIYTKAVF